MSPARARALALAPEPAAAPDPPDLEIVIVSAAGGRDVLRACLRSLEKHPPSAGAARVWLVDNASADGTVEMVAADFPWVSLIALPRNAGFCAANNLVLARTTAPRVLLLNPDTEVTAGALDQALATLAARGDVAVVGVRLVKPDGTFDHAAKRSFPTLVGALGHFTGIGRSGPLAARFGQYRAPAVDEHGQGAVDAVNGAFMLIRREAMEEVGVLDEAYRMYGEDLDWCYRFKRSGWTVFYDGHASVVHVKGAMSVLQRGRGRHRGLRTNVAFHRAMGRFYRKFHGGSRPLVDLLVYTALGLKLGLSVLRGTVARRGLR